MGSPPSLPPSHWSTYPSTRPSSSLFLQYQSWDLGLGRPTLEPTLLDTTPDYLCWHLLWLMPVSSGLLYLPDSMTQKKVQILLMFSNLESPVHCLHLCAHPPSVLSPNPSVYTPTHHPPFIHPPTFLSICSPTHSPSTHPFIHASTQWCSHSSIHSSINPIILSPIYLSIHPSSFLPSIHPNTFLSTYHLPGTSNTDMN